MKKRGEGERRLRVTIQVCCAKEITSTERRKAKDKAGKAVPLQAWTGPEGSSKLRLPDFVTTAQDCGKVSLTHRPPLLQEMVLVLISGRG
jgi:hypothetical protein